MRILCCFVWGFERFPRSVLSGDSVLPAADKIDGTIDTTYKRALMDYLSNNFSWNNTPSVGKLQLEQDGVKVACDLVLLDEWQTVLPERYFS